jgi:acetyltransferase-like isoleucine patch superfamily enzyme
MENIFFNLSDLKHLGKNVIIGKTVRIRHPERVSIMDNTIIDDFVYISCELEIGRNCHIASHVNFSGGSGKAVIGDYSTISNHSSVFCASSDYRTFSMDLPSVPEEERFGGTVKPVFIGDKVVVGAHCCILPGSVLPNRTAYGSYTLIDNDNLEEGHLYAGKKCKKDFGLRGENL